MPRKNLVDRVAEALMPVVAAVAHDPRNLKPGELVRLLNSTPLGAVLDDRRLRRHRERAGARLGDGKTLDLLRYAAWLATQPRGGASPPHVTRETTGLADAYAAKREASRARNAEASVTGRDIGPIPDVADPQRRGGATVSFRAFCESYFPQTFCLAWSEDHLRVIAKIERSVKEGGLFAVAMPRGSGKTSLVEAAVIWAVLTGRRNFVALIGSDEGHAEAMLESIKVEIETNELLLADFPEACFPVAALEGIHNRAKGQLCCGERTRIRWEKKLIVLPTIAGSQASNAIVKIAGLTGGIRGMKFKRVDGQTVRPSLVVIDDPQTDESANSAAQCASRLKLLNGAILGLAGPGKKIAGVMPCTVIRQGDVADQILDPLAHPEWNGERTSLLVSLPTNEKLWREYAERRAESLRLHNDIHLATEFYAAHRAAMDAGAAAAWPARYNADELSAIQHAMNLKIQDEAAFWSEYQNQPLRDEIQGRPALQAEAIAARCNHVPRGTLPIAAERVTAFIDVQLEMLFWVVCAWRQDFTGYVVDYGAFPEQGDTYFTVRDPHRRLADVVATTSDEGRIRAGLDALTAQLLGREWLREDRTPLKVERCLIDASYQTDTVYEACRRSLYAAQVMPSHGRAPRPGDSGVAERKPRPGERVGQHWRITTGDGKRALRHILFDANQWKSFVEQRLSVPKEDSGALTLYGETPSRHRMFADHCTAEYCDLVESKRAGRIVPQWSLHPGRDNHWWDGLIGCAVGASVLGVALPEIGDGKKQRRRLPPGKRPSLSDLARRKRGAE